MTGGYDDYDELAVLDPAEEAPITNAVAPESLEAAAKRLS